MAVLVWSFNHMRSRNLIERDTVAGVHLAMLLVTLGGLLQICFARQPKEIYQRGLVDTLSTTHKRR
jgi:hypothetical protein